MQNFINYRKDIKIQSLTARVVKNENYIEGSTDEATKYPQKIFVDLIYNMLLNPQYRLTLITPKKLTITEKIKGSTD